MCNVGKGRILISGGLMRERFGFPHDATFHSGEIFDSAEVIVEHPDIPAVQEGEPLPLLCPTFRKQDEIVFIGWGVK